MKGVFLLLAFVLSIMVDKAGAVNYLSGEILIDKDREFVGEWVVKAGTNIVIKENVKCTFKGKVLFNGKKDKAISVKGGEKSILSFQNCGEVNITFTKVANLEALEFNESMVKISNSDFENNVVALKFSKNSNGSVEQSNFKNNKIAMVTELKSFAQLTNLSFLRNEKALIVSQGGTTKIKNSELKLNNIGFYVYNEGKSVANKCQFVENEVAFAIHQNNATEISENSFFKNKVAIHGEIMSQITIIDNKFTDNEIAINFIQYVGGIIKGNYFYHNKSGVKLEKKCSPEIRYNTFKENETALFCDFSSYPIITLNNFLNNSFHIKLGIYQSADFENRVGSLEIQVSEALSQNTRRITDFNKQQKVYIGELYAKKNYWDEKTLKEMENKENISTIFDGHDLPETKYEGYGEEKYRIDIVVFKPFLTQPVKYK